MDKQRARGTDCAMFQNDPPWERMVREQGIEFALLKATEGTGYVDPEYADHIERAPDFMRAVAAYHVQRAGSMRQQAEHYAKQRERLAARCRQSGAILMPPVLDFEIADKLVAQQLIDNACEFKHHVREITGETMWLYTYSHFLLGACKNLAPADLVSCPQWLAYYPGFGYSVAATRNPIEMLERGKILPEIWRRAGWVCWQYDGNGGERLPNGCDADFNVANGTLEDMLAIAPVPSERGPDTVPQTPTSKSSQTMRAATPLRAGEGEHTPIHLRSEESS